MKHNKQAFTLIELLVVVLVIGILAAVAVPQYQKAVAKARATEFITIIDAGQKALTAYMLTGEPEKTFIDPSSDHLDELDITIPITPKLKNDYQWLLAGDSTGWSINAMSINDGHIDLMFNSNPNERECAGYDIIGITICKTLKQHYAPMICRDASGNFSGVPPLCN